MRIGEVARRTGLTIHTLRFYERKGLLRSARGPSNYREFTPLTLERLDFIRNAQQLGFTLAEVRGFLELRALSGGCDALRARGEQKLREVEAEMRRLEAIRSGLRELLKACDAPAGCAVVIALEALRR